MLILRPISHDTVWGGEKLLPYSDRSTPRIGHLYSVLDGEGQSNTILNGAEAGKSFGQWFAANKQRVNLGQFDEFPLIIALVEARENLSLQVHPDDAMARELENRPRGKMESFVFLEAPADGTIAGCTVPTLAEVRERLERGEADSLAKRIPVRPGDYLFVEAGTMHALCAGSLVYEIEENVPYTYRFYDWGRTGADGKPRPVQIDKGLRSLNPSLCGQARPLSGRHTERSYSIELLEGVAEHRNDTASVECLTVLDGSAEIDGVRLDIGMTAVLLPGESLRIAGLKVMLARPVTGD
ncbi:MAG: class I mannose-6-phosphate isomerase [Bacteroidales bacterium]